jgi:DNA-directed RNA polymerase specialized sigma24 family protein
MDAFEAHRPHLHAVATRILGSRAEADDALQEAWIRIDRADTNEVDNIGGWLTDSRQHIVYRWPPAHR